MFGDIQIGGCCEHGIPWVDCGICQFHKYVPDKATGVEVGVLEMVERCRKLESELFDLGQVYHRVMDLLRRTKMEHGNCSKRYGDNPKPIACTHCAAQYEIDKLLDEYQGPVVRLC